MCCLIKSCTMAGLGRPGAGDAGEKGSRAGSVPDGHAVGAVGRPVSARGSKHRAAGAQQRPTTAISGHGQILASLYLTLLALSNQVCRSLSRFCSFCGPQSFSHVSVATLIRSVAGVRSHVLSLIQTSDKGGGLTKSQSAGSLI